MSEQSKIQNWKSKIARLLNRHGLALVTSLIVPCWLLGCVSNGSFEPVARSKQEAGDGYCHMRLQPVGPTDVARPTQSRSGDYIDYYGSCDGPSSAEQIRKQQRFERFRFGRDFMPG
jgi:hypothetical protein